jgi:predicted TIM-barrel fold metal-dependent hydrolase
LRVASLQHVRGLLEAGVHPGGAVHERGELHHLEHVQAVVALRGVVAEPDVQAGREHLRQPGDAVAELGVRARVVRDLLDAAGRHFRELRLTIAHCGLPWVDEALFMLTKHPNSFAELSYYIATVTAEELFRFLVHAQQSFVPLEKLFFGTDYPGFLYDPVGLRAKLMSVNDHAERVGADPIPQSKLDGILGDNFARMLGLIS